MSGLPRGVGARSGDASELVFVLKFGDFALQALARKSESVDQLFQFSNATHHAGAVDDQLADRVHHAVEAFESDADGFGGSSNGTVRRLSLDQLLGRPRYGHF